MKIKKNSSDFHLDWQHITLAAIAIVGGIACALIPAAAHYVGPVLSMVVPLALAKRSPLPPKDDGSSFKQLDDEIAVTVINVGTEPEALKLLPDGQLHIGWKKWWWSAVLPGDLVRTMRHCYLREQPLSDGKVGVYISEDELLLVLPGDRSWHTRVLTPVGEGWIFTDYLEKI